MDWMFEDFKTDLDTLNPIVREKALSIAKELIEKNAFNNLFSTELLKFNKSLQQFIINKK